MGKLIGLILLVLCVWVAIEVYEKGMDGAFGGAFAWVSAPLPADRESAGAAREAHSASTAQRIGTKVQSDIDAGARRDTAGEGSDYGDGDAEDTD
jgi:hypothetical protein